MADYRPGASEPLEVRVRSQEPKHPWGAWSRATLCLKKPAKVVRAIDKDDSWAHPCGGLQCMSKWRGSWGD